MTKRLLILFVVVILCVFLSSPALASNQEAGVFNGLFDGGDGVGFVYNGAFTQLDEDLEDYLIETVKTNFLNNEDILSNVLVAPAKWSRGWLDGEVGSWLKITVVGKTEQGVNRYHCEVLCRGDGVYEIIREDTMYYHDKTVNKY